VAINDVLPLKATQRDASGPN